ncbi:preprotein translocase subunit SecA [Porphyromonas catoniae]|uniref:preprotein translocase subunit SecA n=1 Tax=Porphyromonas catoniae TaxID=41976 RepID=UPI0028D2D138|nr:preprotein translocase subunit SecA [Porphyromonas catoniae]
MGFIDFLSKLFGNKSQRDLKEITPWVERIQAVYPEIDALSNDELRERTQSLRERIQAYVSSEREEIAKLKASVEGKDLDAREEIWTKVDKIEKEILEKLEVVLDEVHPEAFAIVKSTARRFAEQEEIRVRATDFDRDLSVSHDFVHIEGDTAVYQNHWSAGGNEITWDMVHYDVQLFGGTVLHKGKIAEMATGEGKTLVATLPVFLNALTGNGVHVVTVNDYLAKRDAEWMGPLYMFHGLSVDCIDKHQPNTPERRAAYNADITFGTNNEFGFDYLRDNMATSPEDLVQRKHNYAIVDEVDSVLIDDARTPLIISGPVPKGDDQLFEQFLPNVEVVVEAQRKLCQQLLIDAKKKISSEDKKEQEEGFFLLFRTYKGMPKSKPLIKYLSEPGIKTGMLKVEEEYMADNMRQMHIVTEELYFVIDEKNNSIELSDKGIDLLTRGTDDPTFFILPDIASLLAELSNQGLSSEEVAQRKEALLADYAVKSERVHTVNQLLKAYTLFEKNDQYVVIDNKVLIVDEQTGRIMDGRRYSDGLHQAIEAKERVKVEAATQTFATITLQNYFRMYHKLSGMTGTAETEAGELWDIYKLDVVVIPTNRPIARHDLNDRIYKTAREKYAAVIEEIVRLVELGRPVLVGTTSVEISELLSKMLTLRKIPHNVLNAKLHQKEAEIVAQAGKPGVVTIATNMAGRGTDIKLTPEVKEAGGLAILGTERHESRRVDRQLRGRAGRQGDPGSSVFFVSLEDHLMRLFASDRLSAMMDKMGFEEGEVLEHSMLNKAVERAQKKVEENNFGIRKRLLEYDDVMNSQREVIYKRRRHALMGERIEMDVMNTLYDAGRILVDTHHPMEDYESFSDDVMRLFAIEAPFDEQTFRHSKADELTDLLYDAVEAAFARRAQLIADQAYPAIHQVYTEQGQHYERIMIPLTDGRGAYQVACNLKEADETKGRSIMREFEKAIVLHIIDEQWKEHLREMDELRNSVQNASYENKDPLLVYKLESYELFRTMIEEMNRKTASILMRIQLHLAPAESEAPREVEVRQAEASQHRPTPSYHESRHEVGSPEAEAEARRRPAQSTHTIGRNDPCPCGSGKKFKHCHGKHL